MQAQASLTKSQLASSEIRSDGEAVIRPWGRAGTGGQPQTASGPGSSGRPEAPGEPRSGWVGRRRAAAAGGWSDTAVHKPSVLTGGRSGSPGARPLVEKSSARAAPTAQAQQDKPAGESPQAPRSLRAAQGRTPVTTVRQLVGRNWREGGKLKLHCL